MKKQIMKRAWEITRKAVQNFGGNSRMYFSAALKQAWEETRMDNSRDNSRYEKAMEIRGMIKKYDLRPEYDLHRGYTGRITCRNKEQAVADNLAGIMATRRQEFLDYWKEIDNPSIEGLAEIQAAKRDLEKWHYEFNKSFDGEYAVGGLGVRKRPEYDLDGMYAKYPRAKAYLAAKKHANSSNYELAAIGDDAVFEVLFGDYEQAMKNMDAKLNEFAERHIWD